MRNKKSLWWIAAVIALPFVVMLGLHIGIALGNYFHININVPNIDAASWFMFFGSYLGGVMTLAGVMITMKHERNIHQYENIIQNLEKEKEKIGNAICGFNLLAPGALYTQIIEMCAASEKFNASNMTAIRLCVNDEMQKVLMAKAELEFSTDIYFMTGNCAACKKPCGIQGIIPEFIKVYDSIGAKIYDTLSKINNYILALERNQACSSAGLENQIVDIKPYQEEINTMLAEIAQYNQNEIQQLMVLGRKYIEQKKQNAYRKCFPVKED